MLKPELKFIKVLDKLKPTQFKALKGSLQDQATTLYWNLWGQFGITPDTAKKFAKEPEDKKLSVMDFAWTAEVKEKFYNHPKHIKFVKKLKAMRTMDWGMWALNSEPCDYEEYVQSFREHAEKLKREELSQPEGICGVDKHKSKNPGGLRTGPQKASKRTKAGSNDETPGPGTRGDKRPHAGVSCQCNPSRSESSVRCGCGNKVVAKQSIITYDDFKMILKLCGNMIKRIKFDSTQNFDIKAADELVSDLSNKYSIMA